MKLKQLIPIFALIFTLSAARAAELPRSEYPRPQFQRSDWINLNGEWDFTFDFSQTGLQRDFRNAESFEGKIIVPFCPESELSGVGHKDFINCIWYRRDITIPQNWIGKKVLLHFGAIYYKSEVYIDGNLVRRHFGGSSSFYADITAWVSDGKTHNLVVRAESDLRSMTQSAGKQSLRYGSYGCNYTRTTGIWQTVWMEAVAPQALMDAQVLTDIDNSQVVIRPRFFKDSDATLKVTLKDGKKTVSTASVRATSQSVVVLPVKKARLWSPESPFLYDLEYIMTDASGKEIDRVESYVGMRKIHISGNKIFLNNQPYYQRLVLDQGFYPDGIWTAPSDEALRRDIELSQAAGFNGARLHQKVFEERFYYWADKLGYITWGESPSWGMDMNNVEALRNFISEWSEVVVRDRNHPSLFTWTPMNETWWPDPVQYPRFMEDLYDLTKALDPARPINDASGGTHIKTDIWTIHSYQQDPAKLKNIIYDGEKFFSTPIRTAKSSSHNPAGSYDVANYPEYDGVMPLLIDEFGGIKWAPESTNAASWGYGDAPRTKEEFISRLAGQVKVILELSGHVWGYCYTQLTDVEQEQNGIWFFDRTSKFTDEELSTIKKIFSTAPEDAAGLAELAAPVSASSGPAASSVPAAPVSTPSGQAVQIAGPAAGTLTLSGLNPEDFKAEVQGKPTALYVLTNDSGMEVCVTNFGGRIVSIMVPDRDGNLRDVAQGFDNINDYVNLHSDFGATIGRYANRINQGRFTLDGITYQLPQNNHGHCLHGGLKGFQYRVFEVLGTGKDFIELSYLCADGEEGFPGNLRCTVKMTLTDENSIDIAYTAVTDKPTVVNLTNHSYFNLDGASSDSPNADWLLYVNASNYTPADSTLMTGGEILPVAGTPMDFRTLTRIGDRCDADFDQFRNGKGIDHNWVLDTAGDASQVCASVVSPASGIQLDVYTTEPGLQVYCGNFLKGALKGKDGVSYGHRTAICLETQKYPDTPNKPQWPSAVLRPGETYTSRCIYRFSVTE